MKQNIQRINPAVPFPKKIPDADSIKLLGTIVREVAYGSAFHMQLKEFGTDIQDNNTCISSNCSLSISSCETEVDDIVERREDMKHHQDTVFQIISPVKEHPVSLQEIHNGCERIKRSLFKTEDEIAEVESQTRTQSAWQEVYKHRFGRETASESHRVGCTHKVGTSPSKIIKEVLYSDNNYVVSVTGRER